MLFSLTARPHLKPSDKTFEQLADALPGLISWWKCDETSGTVCVDSISGYNATYSASTTLGNAPLRAGSAGCMRLTSTSGYGASRGGVVGTPLDCRNGGQQNSFTHCCIVKKLGGGSVTQNCFGWGPGN